MIPNESVFVLQNSGKFSAIRSYSGFPGTIKIEKSLTHLIETGDLANVIDGTDYSNWQVKSYTKSPLKAVPQDVSWLPADYQHGLAVMLTSYLDRPVYMSEIYIEPSNDNPFYLLGISWTPLGVKNFIDFSQFSTAYASSIVNYNSLTNVWKVVAATGFATLQFDLASNLSYTPSPGVVIVPAATALSGTRAQVKFSMQGVGSGRAGLRLSWLDASGNVIDTQYSTDYVNSLTDIYNLVDFIPALAATGQIDIGVFENSQTPLTVTFSQIELLLGENIFTPGGGMKISKPTTITLPTTVHSDRISLVLAQTDPYRETATVDNNFVMSTMPYDRFITPSIQKEINSQIGMLNSRGPQDNFFVYSLGLVELDFRYREFIPHGRLVSKPVHLSREIRNIWLNAEIDVYNGNDTTFNIYPYEDNEKFKYTLNPFLVQNADTKQSSFVEGEVLLILTTEELEAGWGDSVSPTPLILPEIPYTEIFQGSAQDGTVSLKFPPYLSRIKSNSVQQWLNDNSIWPAYFDPNASTVYSVGNPSDLTDKTIPNALRKGSLPTIDQANIIKKVGYIPIRVTVKTDQFIAYPDTYGKPQQSIIKISLGEKLTQVSGGYQTINTSTVTQTKDGASSATPAVTSFSTNNPATLPKLPAGWQWIIDTPPSLFNRTTKYVAVKTAVTPAPTTTNNGGFWWGRFGQNTQATNTNQTVSTVVYNGTYKTAFQNILTGKTGSFIDLYWQNPTTGDLVAITPSNYVLNARDGSIQINTAPPTGFTVVLANYKYISNQGNVTYYNDILDYITPTSTGLFGDAVRSYTTNYPVTRNMTDYVKGTTPTLTPPNFDKLSSDYYPIIEYYVDADSVLHFAANFWLQGDTPGEIEVDYTTLAIRPRVGIEINRVNAPTSSNFIHAVSLGVKEASVIPTLI